MRTFLLRSIGVIAVLVAVVTTLSVAVAIRASTLTVEAQVDKVKIYVSDRCASQSDLLSTDVMQGFYVRNFFGVVNASLVDEERLIYGPFWEAYREAVSKDELSQDPILRSFFWSEEYRLFDLSARIFLSELLDFPYQIDGLVWPDQQAPSSIERAAAGQAVSGATEILLGDENQVVEQKDLEEVVKRAELIMDFAKLLDEPNKGMAEAVATLPKRSYAEETYGIAVKWDTLNCITTRTDTAVKDWDVTLRLALGLSQEQFFPRLEAALSVLDVLEIDNIRSAKDMPDEKFVAALNGVMSGFSAITDEQTDVAIDIRKHLNEGMRS